MKRVHFVLQGKGGVGKTFAAVNLTQFLRDKGKEVIALDADPAAPTLIAFKALKVEPVELLKKKDGDGPGDGGFSFEDEDDEERYVINLKGFDAIAVRAEKMKANAEMVVDTGSNAFLPLLKYCEASNFFKALEDLGCQVIIHTIIAGGQSFPTTVASFAETSERFPETPVIMWTNPKEGPLQRGGKQFQDMVVYKEYGHLIKGVVALPKLHEQLDGHDVTAMLSDGLTYGEAVADSRRGIMERQRLLAVQRKIFGKIEVALTGVSE